MHAVTFQDVHAVRYERVADAASSAPTDVVVRVELSAICGSDLHVFHGRERGLDVGTIMGHEFVGRIVEVGAAVRSLRRDDRVISPFTSSCGSCFYCVHGLTARCTSGQLFGWVQQAKGLHGAQAELVRVPLAESTLLRLPEGVSADEGLLLGDVLATGYYAALRADVVRGSTCAVVGCGPVGLMAVVGARELQADRVFAVDRIPERLERAAQFGATPVNAGTADAVAAVGEATDGRGADGVVEAVGSAAAHRLALELVRPGGTISVVGVHNEERFGFSPAELYDRNVTYRVGRCPARGLMERLVPLVTSRRYDLASILTHRLPLADAAAAYELFDRKRDGCVKVALIP